MRIHFKISFTLLDFDTPKSLHSQAEFLLKPTTMHSNVKPI